MPNRADNNPSQSNEGALTPHDGLSAEDRAPGTHGKKDVHAATKETVGESAVERRSEPRGKDKKKKK